MSKSISFKDDQAFFLRTIYFFLRLEELKRLQLQEREQADGLNKQEHFNIKYKTAGS